MILIMLSGKLCFQDKIFKIIFNPLRFFPSRASIAVCVQNFVVYVSIQSQLPWTHVGSLCWQTTPSKYITYDTKI